MSRLKLYRKSSYVDEGKMIRDELDQIKRIIL